jgi:pyruvate kinase
MKRTKIIATIGPATWTEEKILGLYHQGVNVIRMNFSHRDYEQMARVIHIVRSLNERDLTKLSLLIDNKGPEIRTGKKEQKTIYTKGDIVNIVLNSDVVGEQDIYCDYPYLLDDLHVGDIIRIDSGLFDVVVLEIHDGYCLCTALNDATIGSYRHINLPGKSLKLPALTETDKEDLLFALEHDISLIAMSFVRNATHIQELRAFRKTHGWRDDLHIIAKIENQEGLEHLEEIVKESDGVMVARGDLGIEVPVTMLPYYQEKIMETCHRLGKPVIVATQMIETMMQVPFPTRAEIHDIYQAVQMGADATMLSWETAIGAYPLEAVKFMDETIKTAECFCSNHMYFFDDTIDDMWDQIYNYLLKSALTLAHDIDAAGMVIFTKTGKGAKFLSAYKTEIPILACTRNDRVVEHLWYYYGVVARLIEGNPVIDFTWIMSQTKKLSNLENKPFILIGDRDTIAGAYPTIQVVVK